MKQMNKKQQIIITIFTILNATILAAHFFVSKSTHTFQKTESKVQQVNENKCSWEYKASKNDNFVFLGDSITDWYPLDEMYESLPIVNSGKAGYNTKDILERLDEMVYRYNPTKVVILIGTNDLNVPHPDSNDEIIDRIIKIIQNIHDNRSGAKVYLQSIYPINKTDDEKIVDEVVGKREQEDIIEINKKLQEYCKKNNVTYINVFDQLTDEDGNLNLKYTKDGLHLNTLGYIKVTKTILPYLER